MSGQKDVNEGGKGEEVVAIPAPTEDDTRVEQESGHEPASTDLSRVTSES